MSGIGLKLDHLALAAATLDAGADFVEAAIGIRPGPGGSHPSMGTHNRLLRLGPGEYLEVIAVDPAAPVPGRARWFALDDHRDREPRLTTWVLRSHDLDAALALAPPEVGPAITASRGALRWRITVRDDGATPFDGAYPTLIEWPGDASPAAQMPDRGCRLAGLTITHPQAAEIARLLAPMLDDERVRILPGPAVALTAEIETPHGMRRLG